MNTGFKVGLFAAGLCGVFAAAIAIGTAVGPVGSEAAAMGRGDDQAMADMPGMSEAADQVPGGLQVAQNGYRLVLDEPRQRANAEATVAFQILRRDGRPLTDYATSQDKKLYLDFKHGDVVRTAEFTVEAAATT